jgi:hypothetical protein
MVHKRSRDSLQRRQIRALIFASCYQDLNRCESVCRVSRSEILGSLTGSVEVSNVPDIEKGEILIDSRGQGSFQR